MFYQDLNIQNKERQSYTFKEMRVGKRMSNTRYGRLLKIGYIFAFFFKISDPFF